MSKIFYANLDINGNVNLKGQKQLQLSDSTSSHKLSIQAPSSLSADYTLTMPVDDGTVNQVLATDGSGVLSWVSSLTSALNSQNIFIGNGSNLATATNTTSTGDILANSSTALTIKSAVITNTHIAAAAAIAYSKLATLTASRALVSDGSGVVSVSSVTSTELGYVSGVTSSIQTQINNLSSSINNFEWQPSVLDKAATPPVSPTSGDRYLVIATGTGAFTGHENDIAQYNGSSWVFTTPTTGTYVGIDAESDGLYLFGGSSWAKKYFEATTASTGLTKVGFDIRLDSSAAGNGLGFSAGVLAVNVDNSTIELNSDAIRLKDGGITDAKVNASAAIAYSKLALSNSIVNADINSSAAIAYSKLNLSASIVNADVASGAAIAVNKLAAVTASKALVSDGSGFISASSVTATELGYVSGVTSAIQTQINVKTSKVTATWANGDGTSKAVTHSLGTKDILVQVYDMDDDSTIEVDSIVRTSTSVVTLSATQAPANNWKIVIIG